MGKTLYFEGAGWSGADISKATIGNCRIRTAFHLDNGKLVYLELGGSERTKRSPIEIYQWQYTGFVDYCYYITNDVPNDDCNLHRIPIENRSFEYTEEAILKLVNDLGASFDEIKVVPDLGGYRVFPKEKSGKGIKGYYYGDEFEYMPELVGKRNEVYDYFYKLEQSEGKEYPNFSLWVDENDKYELHLLRHFNGYNLHWIIRIDQHDYISGREWTMKKEFLGE